MANPKLATTDYVDGEVAKKQGYFADVSINETSGNRELSLKDATDKTVGQIIAQKEGGVLFKDVATPTEATDGANKGYADNNFANALKGTASGVSVRLDGVSPIEHTLGVKVSSKNLVAQPYTTPAGTYSGVAITIDSDGTIHLSGTATARIVFFVRQPSLGPVLTIGKQYTMSGYISGSGANLGIQDTTYHAAYTISTAGETKTFTATYTNYYIFITVNANVTTDAVIQPYLELGSTATAYTPYISDFSTVTVTRCGKNLFDKSTLTASTSITEFAQTANGFTFKTAATQKTTMVSSNIYLPAGTYYCSGTVTCSDANYKGGWGVYDDENKKFIINYSSRGTINDKFTITESKIYQLNFYAPYSAPIRVTMTFGNVQLELGATATEYELYKTAAEFTPAADGTVSGVLSLSPTTTLITNTSGATIDAEYNRDINKAFAEMQQAILSMGGNV